MADLPENLVSCGHDLSFKCIPHAGPLLRIERAGQYVTFDFVDGKFVCTGNVEPTEGARLFIEQLGALLEARIQEEASKLANSQEPA